MKRKPSERTLFERWYVLEYGGYDRKALREDRAPEGGYNTQRIDWAWMGWLGRAKQPQP